MLLDYQLRAIEERDALNDKINKLYIFIGSYNFNELNFKNRFYLRVQYLLMAAYKHVLNLRIKEFAIES